MKVELRAVTTDDNPFLAELDAEVHAAEFAGAGLAPAALAQLLAMQYRARTMGYAAQFPQAESSVVWIGPHRIGRVLVNETEQALLLVDIVLLEAYRGSGIGSGLLKQLIERAHAKGLPVRLSVRATNPAARLYGRLGFAVTGHDAVYLHMELGGIQGAGSLARQEVVTPAERVPKDASSEYFRWLVGKTVEARCIDGMCAELHVTSVTLLHSSQAEVEANDSFVVSFTGPVSPAFSQMLCELREPDESADGEREALVVGLVPLGPKDGVMRYESVFNRMQRKSAIA